MHTHTAATPERRNQDDSCQGNAAALLPFALIGGFWVICILGHQVSIATAAGFIALAGVAAEFGVVMLIYLKHSWEERLASGRPPTVRDAR